MTDIDERACGRAVWANQTGRAAPMDIAGIFSWLFSSREGVLVLLGVILVGFLVAAIVLERKTRKDFDQYDDEDDDESGWSLFDDDNK